MPRWLLILDAALIVWLVLLVVLLLLDLHAALSGLDRDLARLLAGLLGG